jgi:hypothetical protein
MAGFANCDDLGVRGRIACRDDPIAAAADNFSLAKNDRAERAAEI